VCELTGKKWLSGMKISRLLYQTNRLTS